MTARPSTAQVSIGWRAFLSLLRLLPQGALSRAWGAFAETRFPSGFQRRLNRGFAQIFRANVAEAERPPEAYPSLSDFFVRRLQPGVRRWPEDSWIPGSPVDGVLGSHGTLVDGIALQAKGIRYRVADLLGSEERARDFSSGVFITLYLSPRHYHRIHSPLTGDIAEAIALPGRLLPVNLPAVRSITDLFPRNERLVAFLEGSGIRAAVVAVGAYNVGRISAPFDPEWGGSPEGSVTNLRGRRSPDRRSYSPPLPIERGEELMAFHLGSTIVLLLSSETEQLTLHPELREGEEVPLGTELLAPPNGRGLSHPNS